jgi:hypothetical protein
VRSRRRGGRGRVTGLLNLKTEMAEGESAVVIGPTRHPASRVASLYPGLCSRIGKRRWSSLDLLEDGVHPWALLAWQ